MQFETADIIEKGGLNFSGEISEISELTNLMPAELGQTKLPLKVQFEISIGSKEFLLLGNLRGSFNLSCSRCLSQFPSSFEQHLEQLYPKNIAQIDVTDTIREAIVLALPTKPLCGENCRGLCPHCGINLNTSICDCKPQSLNPFAKLKGLKSQLDRGSKGGPRING